MSLITSTSYPLTSIFHLPPKTECKTPEILVFIPGNPGLVEYYISYLNVIQKAHPTFEIFCVSQAGYQTTGNYQDKAHNKHPVYDLQYQVDHKYKIICDIVAEKGDVNLYIMAHSVGAYITQRVVKKLETNKHINLKFIGLICPTVVNIKESSSGQKLVSLSRYVPVVRLAMTFSWLLSTCLTENMIKWLFVNWIFSKPKLEVSESAEALKNSVEASYKLVSSPRIVKQALTMAIEEMDMILDDEQLNNWFFKDLTSRGIKIWTYFAFSDHWVHDNTRSYILSKFHDESNHNISFQLGNVDDAITHSFCVDQSVEFGEVTVQMMDRFGVTAEKK